MTKNKKILIAVIAAVAAVAIVGVVLLVTLNNKSTVTAVSVGRNEMPRLAYVQGQELDLSAGKLTVEYSDGKIEALPLNAEGISVTGYDKTVLGKQTVTVSFGDRSTTIDVTVIARMAVENAQTVYYVGEALDTSRGKVTIANDDATTFSVPFSDEKVSFQGFDSGAPVAEQSVTVTYRSGDADYSAGFAVAIYSTDNAKLNPPNKTSYRSHEEFRVNGAYITYSNGDPAFDKTIPVTADMVTGLDFSLVTADNSPMEQTAVVTYGGKEYEFSVTVTYSQVTHLQNLLKEYAFAWTEPTIPEISPQQGERATECARMYFELSATERAYIASDSIENAIRTAAVYTYGLWDEELQSCSGSFVIDEEGLKYRLSSYAAASADAATVSDAENTLNGSLILLGQISKYFKTLTVGGETLENYLAAVDVYAEHQTELVNLLSFTTSLYRTLDEVPEDWTDLSAYGQAIDSARDLIANSEFGDYAYRDVIAQVSAWRANNDFFDIVYSYYVQNQDTASIDKLKEIILPAKLNRLYDDLISAIIEYNYIYNGTDSGKSSDTTFLMYYYQSARSAALEILSGSNEIYQQLYRTLTFSNVLASATGGSIDATFDDIFNFIEMTELGYYYLLGPVLDDPEIVALWDAYLELVTDTAEEDVPARMQAFMERFAALSPAQLMSYLLSLNVYYDGYDKLSLDTDVNYTFLIRMLKNYYSEILSEDEFAMFRNLLLSIESYARMNDEESAVVDFLGYLSAVRTAYDSLDSKTVFQENFDAIYRKYLGIAALYNEDGTLKTDFTVDAAWQATFDALAGEINNMYYAYSLIAPGEGKDVESAYVRLYASYENARRYVDSIVTNAPESVKEAYYHRRVPFFDDYQWTLDYAMKVQAMGLAMLNYADLNVSGKALWEIIGPNEAFRAFLANAEPVLWMDADSESTPSVESAVRLMKDFLSFTDVEKVLFLQLQGLQEERDYYYDGLSAVFARHFAQKEKLKGAADALLDVEIATISYRSWLEGDDPEKLQTALTELQNSLAALQTALDALSPEDRAQFDGYFSEILAYYQEANADLSAA